MRVLSRCALIVCLICAVPWLLRTRALLAFSGERGPDTLGRTITVAERVAYQYGIEEVYWRHRIWPKDNPGPKPPLDAVIPRDQLERKVENYLRKSHAVADQRGEAITSNELQAEMDRMARDTKQPAVLRELFAALGNDAFVIAECLARPIIAERFAGEPAKDGGVEAFVSNAVKLAAASVPASQAYRLPEILDDCTDDTWTSITTVNAPQARGTIGRGVWTGSEMIIWGGSNGTGLNTGGRYDPVPIPGQRQALSTRRPGEGVTPWYGQVSKRLSGGATSSWLAVRTPAADTILSLIAG